MTLALSVMSTRLRGSIVLSVVQAVFEGVADHALHAFAGVYVFLDRNFVGSALLEVAADVDVNAFGVFAETTKSTSLGSTLFSGHNEAWSRRTGRTFAYRSILKRMPSRISLAWMLEGTRGSPKAPSRIASKSRASMAKASGGTVTPSRDSDRRPSRMLSARPVLRGFHHSNGLRDDLLADAIPGNYRDALFCATGESYQMAGGIVISR